MAELRPRAGRLSPLSEMSPACFEINAGMPPLQKIIPITLRQFLLQYVLPAVLLLFAAFWFGAQSGVIFALAGFLSCFLIAVTLITEGWKKYKKASELND